MRFFRKVAKQTTKIWWLQNLKFITFICSERTQNVCSDGKNGELRNIRKRYTAVHCHNKIDPMKFRFSQDFPFYFLHFSTPPLFSSTKRESALKIAAFKSTSNCNRIIYFRAYVHERWSGGGESKRCDLLEREEGCSYYIDTYSFNVYTILRCTSLSRHLQRSSFRLHLFKSMAPNTTAFSPRKLFHLHPINTHL